MYMRRAAVVGTATASLMMMTATGALAHDCFVVNRSAQGSVSVGHSQVWFSASAAEGYYYIFDGILGVEGDLDALVEAALAEHVAAGLPEAIAIFEHHLLLTNPRTGEYTPAADKNGGDGKGVDHFSASPLGAQMVGIALSVLPAP